MIIYLLVILFVILAYVLGSINFAIPITRAVKGVDIRDMGNNNPGSSNVMREVGIFWGILVILFDGLKILIPIVLLRIFLFDGNNNFDFGVLFLMGIFGVVGHCKSIFLKFTGGGGISTMQGVFLFFVPVEYLGCMLLSGFFIFTVFRKSEFRFGQKGPICILTMTPFAVLLTALFVDIPFSLPVPWLSHIGIGGHNPAVVVGTFAMALTLLFINGKFLKSKERKTALN